MYFFGASGPPPPSKEDNAEWPVQRMSEEEYFQKVNRMREEEPEFDEWLRMTRNVNLTVRSAQASSTVVPMIQSVCTWAEETLSFGIGRSDSDEKHSFDREEARRVLLTDNPHLFQRSLSEDEMERLRSFAGDEEVVQLCRSIRAYCSQHGGETLCSSFPNQQLPWSMTPDDMKAAFAVYIKKKDMSRFGKRLAAQAHLDANREKYARLESEHAEKEEAYASAKAAYERACAHGYENYSIQPPPDPPDMDPRLSVEKVVLQYMANGDEDSLLVKIAAKKQKR